MLCINYFIVLLVRKSVIHPKFSGCLLMNLLRAELMVKEILDKLRRCDKTIKTKHTGEATQQPQLPDQTMRWLQSILQLMNYRFIRFLKYSSFSSGLLHYIRYSISYLENRQCYQTLESFAINVIVSVLAI